MSVAVACKNVVGWSSLGRSVKSKEDLLRGYMGVHARMSRGTHVI